MFSCFVSLLFWKTAMIRFDDHKTGLKAGRWYLQLVVENVHQNEA